MNQIKMITMKIQKTYIDKKNINNMHFLILFFILFVGSCSPVYGQATKNNRGTVLEGSSGVRIERLSKSDSIDPFAWSYISMTAKSGVEE